MAMTRTQTTTTNLWKSLATAALLLCRSTVVTADEEYYNQFSVCADSAIVVEELMITCDSPGSYYYGSNKYRNSATCQGGDKAKLQVMFEIMQDLDASPYLTLNVAAAGSVRDKQLYYQGDLCSLDSLQSYDGSACPNAGVYLISDKFYFDSQEDEYDTYNFNPVPSIGFQSDVEMNYFDLGGANTNFCAGGTFQNWSTGMGNSASATLRFFLGNSRSRRAAATTIRQSVQHTSPSKEKQKDGMFWNSMHHPRERRGHRMSAASRSS